MAAKIGHARQPVEVDATHRPEAIHDRIEQRAEHAGPRDFELAPLLVLRTPLRLNNWLQGQKNRSVAAANNQLTINTKSSRLARLRKEFRDSIDPPC